MLVRQEVIIYKINLNHMASKSEDKRKKAMQEEESPTKKSEARAKKQDDLSTVDTAVDAPKKEEGRATIPPGARPSDRIQ